MNPFVVYLLETGAIVAAGFASHPAVISVPSGCALLFGEAARGARRTQHRVENGELVEIAE